MSKTHEKTFLQKGTSSDSLSDDKLLNLAHNMRNAHLNYTDKCFFFSPMSLAEIQEIVNILWW